MSEFAPNRLPKTLAAVPSGGSQRAILAFKDGELKSWSFTAVLEAADKFSAGVQDYWQKNDLKEPVILFSPASGPAIIAVLGVLRAGGVVVPLDTQMVDDDLVQVLENHPTGLVLTTGRLKHRLDALEGASGLASILLDKKEDGESESSGEKGKGAFWETLFMDTPVQPGEPEEDDTAVLFYTSGTTGPPKGVPLSHRNICFQLKTVIETGLVRMNDRLLQPLPLHHVYPFVIGTLAPLALGLPVILPGGLTGKALVTAMQDGEASVTIGVPRLYKAFYDGLRDRLAAVPGGRLFFTSARAVAKAGNRIGIPIGTVLFRPVRRKVAPRLRLLASGGSSLDPALGRNLEALGWPVAVGYGLTETAPLLTLKKQGEATFDSVGRAVEGVELRVDPSVLEEEVPEKSSPGSLMETGKGELLARGPNVFAGYHKNKEADKKSFTEDGWFRTGDLARIDSQGMVCLLGRVSTRIALQGGENVDPATLEDHYGAAAGIKDIGVLEHGGKLAALVVPEDSLLRDKGLEDAATQVREVLQDRGRDLPSYQRLSLIEVRSGELARTRLGKIRRHELREAYEAVRRGESGDEDAGGRSGPLSEDEFTSEERGLLANKRARALWELLCERYPDRPIAPDAHLESDLGIDSLEWVELSIAVEEATGAVIDEEMIARAERLKDLLEIIAEAKEGEDQQRISEVFQNPASMFDETERRWVTRRSSVRLAVASLLFFLARLYLRLMLRVEARGLENLPEHSSYLLTPNHTSFLDAPCLGVALGYQRARHCFWAGFTGVMFHNWFVREISRLGQVVPIDAQRGPISSLAMAASVLEQECPLVWFPEGRISEDGSLQEFQAGIGALLKHRNVSVVPVYIEGTHDALPRGKRLPRRGKVRVYFGRALSARELRGDDGANEPQEVAGALRTAIEKLSMSRNKEQGDG